MIPVVGFNAVLMSEHFGAFFAFGVLHGALFIRYVKVRSSHIVLTLCVCLSLRLLPFCKN